MSDLNSFRLIISSLLKKSERPTTHKKKTQQLRSIVFEFTAHLKHQDVVSRNSNHLKAVLLQDDCIFSHFCHQTTFQKLYTRELSKRLFSEAKQSTLTLLHHIINENIRFEENVAHATNQSSFAEQPSNLHEEVQTESDTNNFNNGNSSADEMESCLTRPPLCATDFSCSTPPPSPENGVSIPRSPFTFDQSTTEADGQMSESSSSSSPASVSTPESPNSPSSSSLPLSTASASDSVSDTSRTSIQSPCSSSPCSSSSSPPLTISSAVPSESSSSSSSLECPESSESSEYSSSSSSSSPSMTNSSPLVAERSCLSSADNDSANKQTFSMCSIPSIQTEVVQLLSSTNSEAENRKELKRMIDVIDAVRREVKRVCNEVPLHEGLLYFKRQFFREFRPRWAILTQTRLIYFPLDEIISPTLVRVIPLRGGSLPLPLPEQCASHSIPFVFYLATPNAMHSSYFIHAVNEDSFKTWVTTIQDTLHNYPIDK